MPFEILLVASIVLPLLSALYIRAGDAMPMCQRVAGSVHALLIAAIVPYGLAVDAATSGTAGAAYQLPIYVCVVLGAASMLYSFWAFRSRPLLLLAHLVTIAFAVPAIFIAIVAVGGWT